MFILINKNPIKKNERIWKAVRRGIQRGNVPNSRICKTHDRRRLNIRTAFNYLNKICI